MLAATDSRSGVYQLSSVCVCEFTQITNHRGKIPHHTHETDTHLKVGQDHLSVHVAVAALGGGGHGNDWLKAILLLLLLLLLPPALVASLYPHAGTLVRWFPQKTLCSAVATRERLANLGGNVKLCPDLTASGGQK